MRFIFSFIGQLLQTFYRGKRKILNSMARVILILGFIQGQFQLIVNLSQSLPQPYFLQVKNLNPKKGHFTLTWNAWLGKHVIKQIIGQDGDRLHYDEKGFLWLNDFKIGKPQTVTKKGQSLTPIPAGMIPPGYVLLYAPAPRSFDSRYQEFGLVPREALQGRLLPLNTFWRQKL
jgi:conjugal transfer pilin signal peptidase TrbI